MNERLTPEEIVTDSALAADDWGDWAPSDMLEALAAHGYVLVHPDDVPEKADHWEYNHQSYVKGWNACRDAILGAGVREGTG